MTEQFSILTTKEINELIFGPWPDGTENVGALIVAAQQGKTQSQIVDWLGSWLDINYADHRIDIGEIAGGKCPHCALVQAIEEENHDAE